MRIIGATVLTNVNLDGLHLIVGVGISLNDELERLAKEKAHLQELRNVITHRWQAHTQRLYVGGSRSKFAFRHFCTTESYETLLTNRYTIHFTCSPTLRTFS